MELIDIIDRGAREMRVRSESKIRIRRDAQVRRTIAPAEVVLLRT